MAALAGPGVKRASGGDAYGTKEQVVDGLALLERAGTITAEFEIALTAEVTPLMFMATF
jgi:hypothetical protein